MMTPALEQALREETEAWKMARRMARAARKHDENALRSALPCFVAFLGNELEVHMGREEADLFPHLAARGLGVEVEEAARQHAELRALAADLERCAGTDVDALRRALETIGRAMLRHTRYEADFLYVDLETAEVSAFRRDVNEVLRSMPPSFR